MISRWSQGVWLILGLAAATAGACGPSGSTATSSNGGGANGGAGGAGGGTTTTTSTSASSSTGAPVPSQVGDACAADVDCGPGLICVLPTASDPIFGGGAPGGYCSTSCALDIDCPGTDSLCLVGSLEVGNCVEICKLGPALDTFDDPLAPTKCRGRTDLRCTSTSTSADVCLPTCSSDSQCATGMVCDPRTAICLPAAATGLPDGAKCSTSATPPDCAGVCVSFTGTDVTMCSQACVLGGDPAHPAASPSCGGVTRGLCIFKPAGNGAGDYGFCSPACSKQDDCQNPDFWCLPQGGLTGTNGVTNGFCKLGTPCPKGASDCSGIPQSTCTDTLYGPICLAGGFPLGGAAPNDGGVDDGGLCDGSACDGGVDDGGDSGVDDGGVDAGVDDGGTPDAGTDAGDGG
jgi:hypothetical protein